MYPVFKHKTTSRNLGYRHRQNDTEERQRYAEKEPADGEEVIEDISACRLLIGEGSVKKRQ